MKVSMERIERKKYKTMVELLEYRTYHAKLVSGGLKRGESTPRKVSIIEGISHGIRRRKGTISKLKRALNDMPSVPVQLNLW